MNPTEESFPTFLSRSNLKFGRGASFELIITSQSNTATTLTLRSVNRESISKFAHTTTNNGVVQSSVHKISDVPIAVSVKDEGLDLIQGDCYITLSLRIDGSIVYELAAGWVYGNKGLTWPTNNALDAIPGRGRFREITVGDPGAGNEVSQAVPVGRVWHLLAASFNLTTDANVANRRVHFAFSGIGGIGIHCYSSVDQTAGLGRFYSLAQYGVIPDETDATVIMMTIPPNLYLGEGSTLLTTTTNFQAGDAFTTIALLVEEFFVPPA